MTDMNQMMNYWIIVLTHIIGRIKKMPKQHQDEICFYCIVAVHAIQSLLDPFGAG